MKKIYFASIICFASWQFSHAQLTLTKVFNEPAVGDVKNITEYDSTAVIPKSTGANQTWNFTSLSQTTVNVTSTYVSPSSVPSSSVFTGCNLVENMGGGEYNYWKLATTPTTQLEFLGNGSSGPPFSAIHFTNSSIAAIWPMAPGSTFTDSFSGPMIGANGGISGSQTVTASGSGTIILPGGASYADIVQVKTQQKNVTSITILSVSLTFTNTLTQYFYMHPTQKFPLVEVSYELSDDGTQIDTTVTIKVNKNITIGIADRELGAAFAVFPNPAKDSFSISLENSRNETCIVEIYNSAGQLVQSVNLGDKLHVRENIDIWHLAPDIYTVKTSLGNKAATKKLIVE